MRRDDSSVFAFPWRILARSLRLRRRPQLGKDSRIFPSNRAETRSVSTLRAYTRVRGGFFDSAHSSFSRSRVLRNCRCQSSRRVDIARDSLARSLAAVVLFENRKKGDRIPRRRGACRIFEFIGLREKSSRGGRKRERKREGEQLFGKESSGPLSNAIFEENGLRGEDGDERDREKGVER